MSLLSQVRGSKNKTHVKIHPTQITPGNQDQRDSRKHKLEIHHRGLRESLIHCLGGQITLPQLISDIDGGAGDADKGQHVLPEPHLVGPEDPAEEDGTEGVEGHEGAVDGPFVLHPAGVEDDETGDRLESDQGGGCESGRRKEREVSKCLTLLIQ